MNDLTLALTPEAELRRNHCMAAERERLETLLELSRSFIVAARNGAGYGTLLDLDVTASAYHASPIF